MERTLVLIKPDGVERGLIGEIISAYEKRTLKITDLKMLQADREIAEKHYEEHKGRPYFETLISYIIEGKIVAMVVEGENAIEMVRKINGDKNPLASDLASIRGMYSNHKTRNLVHASDSVESAEREISIWFGN
ncbi:MAG: nucleoside-diphosphate kinase [Clostridiales bacterium]|nr:nucleoside-diphosphate kinase [Clostridiales bacterium]